MAEASSTPHAAWNGLKDEEISQDIISDVLGSVQDDVWATVACVDRVLDDVSAEQSLLLHGISRTDSIVERCRDILFLPSSTDTTLHTDQFHHTNLLAHFQNVPADARLFQLRVILLQRLDRLNTYIEMERVSASTPRNQEEDEIDEWEDDPWAEGASTIAPSAPATPQSTMVLKLPIPLSAFLINDVVWSARELASLQWFDALRILLQKHAPDIWPYRFSVLEYIPEHTPPSAYRDILPALDPFTNLETTFMEDRWRPELDLVEKPNIQVMAEASGSAFQFASYRPSKTELQPHCKPLTPTELSTWYSTRVDTIINSTGMVDVALSIIQHGASQGIPELDELGEELSLLSRLIYDAPQGKGIPDDWTLTLWRSLGPQEVIHAYLAHSTPGSLPHDISHLISPYLFVLEARAERAGIPDPSLPDRLLYDYILPSSLDLAAAIFEASKPTLPAAQRLIRNDEDVARLALACIYGSNSLDEWSTMSRIFECLPAWENEYDEDNHKEVDSALASLAGLVTPTTSHPRCTPNELFAFFKPLTATSLTRALDILDVHLESGEILFRWSVPAATSWFLRSAADVSEQRAWATRMARRAGGSFDPLNTREDWEWLLDDMLKLTERSESGLKGAFGLLTSSDVISIFFSGLLNSGKFDIAKAILQDPSGKIALPKNVVEDICLSCSRELYDNASTGSYKVGDMKLAYDCLDVPVPSKRIVEEKEFIEATSRICSFNVWSHPGVPISPIEIRLTKDRLSLVSRVLSSNNDAYKHTEVILDLCYKLGFRDDLTAEVKVLAMLADAALQAEDFSKAFENSERMFNIVSKLRSATNRPDNSEAKETAEVCWVACFQLGRQSEFEDLPKKMTLLGSALELCPPERIHDVLTAWRRLQKEDTTCRQERLVKRQNHSIGNSHSEFIPKNVASSLRARLQDFHMPSPPLLSTPDAAALASRTFRSVTAKLPFAAGHHALSQASSTDERESHNEGPQREGDVSSQASRAISKGIGWLIGVDD